MKLKLLLSILLISYSPWVFASRDDIPWEWSMVIIGTISAIIATYLAVKNDKADTFGLKVLLGGLYFWIVVFAQTVVIGLLYYLFG